MQICSRHSSLTDPMPFPDPFLLPASTLEEAENAQYPLSHPPLELRGSHFPKFWLMRQEGKSIGCFWKTFCFLDGTRESKLRGAVSPSPSAFSADLMPEPAGQRGDFVQYQLS